MRCVVRCIVHSMVRSVVHSMAQRGGGVGHLQLLQRDGELELVLGVGGDGEGLLLEALRR